jgi:FkbM family methyltransferase
MARKIFIDCGGHDGCSVIQFLWQRPGFEVVTFEPNPVFRGYYRYLPTQLVPRAVGEHDGTVTFTVDPIDGDGSSIVPGKDIVFDNSLANYQCPTVEVGCIDLSNFVARNVSPNDYLCLKLDVEGAEYAILEKMIRDGTIDRVDELLIEFHWFKCGVAEDVHDRLVAELENRTVVRYWDAGKQAIHRRDLKSKLRRALMLVVLWPRHLWHGGFRQRGFLL